MMKAETAGAVSVVFKVLSANYELSGEGPFVLPLSTSREELRDLVNELVSDSSPARPDWAFRLGAVRVDSTIADAAEKQTGVFNTESTVTIYVFVPVSIAPEIQDAGDTPDAIIKILPSKRDAAKLLCLGSRANVTLKQQDQLNATNDTIIRTDEPNSVDLLPLDEEAGVYLLVTACGALFRIDTAESTSQVVAIIESVEHRITAAAVNGDRSTLAIGDAEGNIELYAIEEALRAATAVPARKRPLAATVPILRRPTLRKEGLHGASVTFLEFHEDAKTRLFSLLSGGLDGLVKVSDYIDGSTVNTFSTGKPITAMSTVAELLVTGHVDGRVKIWKPEPGSEMYRDGGALACVIVMQPHQRAVTDVDSFLSRGRRLIVSCSNDRKVAFSDAVSGLVELVVTTGEGAEGQVGDYGLYPTALHLADAAAFVGTNNHRIYKYALL